MKNRALLLIWFVVQNLTAQEESYTVDDLLYNGISARAKSVIEKNRERIDLENAVILERSGQFSGIREFHNQGVPANGTYFEQALTDIYLATNKQRFTDFSGLRQMIPADELVTDHEVSIAILNTSYQTINYNTENPYDPNNGFVYTEGVSLTPIEGRNQFTNHHTTVIAPLKQLVKGDQITFKFSSEMLFSDGKTIKNLSADMGDGVYRTVITNGDFTTTSIGIPIGESAELVQNYRIQYSDGTTETTQSTLYARSESNPPMSSRAGNTEDFWHISAYAFQGYEESEAIYGAIEYRVFYANADKVLRKPVFILDGFDPGDKRKIEYVDYAQPNDTIDNPAIYEMMKYVDSNTQEQNMVESLRTKDYDVIICNFPNYNASTSKGVDFLINNHLYQQYSQFLSIDIIDGGADYVERNALAFASLLQDINAQLSANGSEEELVVLGPSMGAIISRYALAYMEKQEAETGDPDWNHNTRLWVSMDGPHLGANIPIGIQSLLNLLKVRGKSAAADSYNNSLKSVTAKQFLINQHKEAPNHHQIDNSYMNGRVLEQGFSNEGGAPFYKRFYKALYSNGLPGSKGFPVNLRKIAIVNGLVDGTRTGGDNEEKLYIKIYNQQTNIYLGKIEIWNLPATGYGSAIISKYDEIFKSDLTTIATNYSARGNFDLLSGGLTDTYEVIKKGAKDDNFRLREIIYNKSHSFIPTVSALAISQPQSNWEADISEQIYCNIGEPNNLTPFDNYFVPFKNEEHIQLTSENTSWLFQELDRVEGVQDLEGRIGTGMLQVYNEHISSGEFINYNFDNISAGNVVVENNAEANFTADGMIRFNSGFRAEPGASVRANIAGFSCDTGAIFSLVPAAPVFQEMVTSKEQKKTLKRHDELVEFDNSYQIYPNPNSGIFYFDAYEQVESLKIFNHNGVPVLEQNEWSAKEMNVSHLITGSYILKLFLKDGTQATISMSIQH